MKPNTKNTQTIPLEEVEDTLYAKHKKIYPRQTRGVFRRLRTLSGVVLLGIFYILPWFQWGGHQAVRFDLPARQFHLFGLTLWPQDLIYLTFLLIIAGFSLFFFTTLAGRLWCGYACPQTVWTDIFLWMERLTEGDRMQRIKLDKSPFSKRKLQIKATKHTIWIVFSIYTGLTFVGFFSPIREIAVNFFTFNLSESETFWLFFYAFATYGNAGWLREQICTYMCPYARFQSAMFDDNTLIIAYNEKRGEPRGSRKRKENYQAKGLGDCINCTLCVQVCPVGIDIRDGLQYQCIGCAACIDACDDIMAKMSYPKGLVLYTTQNALDNKLTQVLRPRVFIYAALLLVLLSSLIYAMTQRIVVKLDVIRDRNSLFKETDTGLIQNVYLLKIMNMDEKPHVYQVTVKGIKDVKLETDLATLKVESGSVLDFPVRLTVDPQNLSKSSSIITFNVTATDNPSLTANEDARFLGPSPSR